MGHKVNPIALRLPVHRAHESTWYSDRQYGDLVAYDAAVRSYIGNVANSAHVPSGPLLSHIFPKHHQVYATFHLDASGSSQGRRPGRRTQALSLPTRRKDPLCTFVSTGESRESLSRHLLAHWALCQNKSVAQPVFENGEFPAKLPLADLFAFSAQTPTQSSLQKPTGDQNPCHAALETHASMHSGMTTSITGLQGRHIFQSAAFVAHFIARALEQKKSVRYIWTRLLQEDKRNLRGLRISCAGRIGGIELAKVDSRKWGQTPLHTFSQKVDYSAQRAQTTYGTIGIKVWLCYAENPA
jgi:ribosomal protein S3